VVLSSAEREQLVAIAADRNRSRKHVERARIVLASADRHPARGWRKALGSAGRRYADGNNALPRAGLKVCCATRLVSLARRRSRRKPRVVAFTCTEPPHQATLDWPHDGQSHWHFGGFGAAHLACAQAATASAATFKRSRDPSFAAKLTDIVGLYVDRPAHAVVLSIDEK
jgi:hypothetical protein